MKKSISIFGCTGTIGRQMLALLENARSHYEVITLTAQNNLLMLAQNAIKFNAKTVVLGNKTLYPELKRLLQGRATEILIGKAGLVEACKQPVDISIMAISGFAGLTAITEMLKHCKIMGIANKEPIVCAGKIIMQLSRQYGVEIVPLDSEHHAITKLIKNSPAKNIAKVTITASGGPFFHYTKQQLSCITPAQATSHPVWQMGKKISIDSATMMNKCLELIEAHNLFDIDHNCLEAVIHPQALIHAFVEYYDSTVTALMHNPDMKIVLASIIARPDSEPIYHNPMPLHSLSHIEVFEPDYTKHRAFHIAKTALQQGGNAPIVVNAANEFAVELFCRKQISFTEIIPLIERALDAIPFQEIASIDEVQQCHNAVSAAMQNIIAAPQAC